MENDPEPLVGPFSPAAAWDLDAARRSLDELFRLAGEYKTTAQYHGLLKFIGRFRFYSPYNAMLVHVQRPGAVYVAPPHRWLGQYGRRIKPEARPLVILQPMGPVMFVYDVSDTEPEQDAPPLPREVERPFEVHVGKIGSEWYYTVENVKRDGVKIIDRDAGSQDAGKISEAVGASYIDMLIKEKPEREYARVQVRYELLLNSHHSWETKYATIAHELGHLYCGHLGTPNEKWWPDRRGLNSQICEFEAESISYLVCTRLGIDTPSAAYLSGYIGSHEKIPQISLECVVKAAGLIEQMGRGRLQLRKER